MTRFHPRQWPGAPRRLLQRISRKNRLLAGILGLTVLATGTLMATAPSPTTSPRTRLRHPLRKDFMGLSFYPLAVFKISPDHSPTIWSNGVLKGNLLPWHRS